MKKRALITGGSAGLGVEFARQLAARGCDLLLVARREEKLREVADLLRAEHGVDVAVASANLANPSAPAALQAQIEDRGLQVDYLVNNAGSAGPNLLDDTDWKEQAAFLELMMISVAQMCHRFIPGMRARGFGRVINVSSFAGRLARPAGSNYGPAKAYVIALSEELSLDLRGTGVHVSALCPGFVHTEFHEVANLMHMKRATPKFIWYEAPTVVREGLDAVERGRDVQISGRIYRWLDPFTQSVWTRGLAKSIAPGR